MKTFDLPIFGDRICILTTPKEAHKVYKDDDYDFETISGACFKQDKIYYIYINTVKQGGRLSVASVSHECVHCAFDILYDSGVHTSASNQEALAYLQDYLVDFVLTWWLDVKKGVLSYKQKHLQRVN